LQEVRQNAECPSVSPDGTKVAYKKRPNQTRPWELVVLDLAAKRELILPGTSGIDDQAVWLDNSTLAYGAAINDQKNAIFFVPADGSAPAREVIPSAASPVPVQ
jgi:Tol biopolymer transport system component